MRRINFDWIDALLIAGGMALVIAVFTALQVKLSQSVLTHGWSGKTWGDSAVWVAFVVFTVGPVKLRRKLFGGPATPLRGDESKVSASSLIGLLVVFIGVLLLASAGYVAVLRSESGRDWEPAALWAAIFAGMVVLGALLLRAASPRRDRSD
jgi:hypothetical protein